MEQNERIQEARPDEIRLNHHQSWNVIAVFLLLIFGFTIATILRPVREFSERENRSLTGKPAVTAESVLDGSFEKNYEEYLTDQFVFRDEWIAIRTMAERVTLHSDVHDVYFAKDDYLIEKHTNVFDTDRAEANLKLLSEFVSQAADRYGSEHVSVMIVPNAVDILREKLPVFAAPYDEETYLQRAREEIGSEDVWFDAADVLRSHKDEYIYYRTDHHWTTLGAYYAFQAWAASRGLIRNVREWKAAQQDGLVAIEQIPGSDHYEITTVTEDFQGTVAAKVGIRVKGDSIQIFESRKGTDYDLVYNQTDDVRSTVYQMRALEGRDKYSLFFGGNYGLIQASTDADTGRRLLVIKDSYAHCFAPFLLDYYDQVDLVDLRYFNQSLREFMENGNYTDVLVLQNAAGFAEDPSIAKLAA